MKTRPCGCVLRYDSRTHMHYLSQRCKACQEKIAADKENEMLNAERIRAEHLQREQELAKARSAILDEFATNACGSLDLFMRMGKDGVRWNELSIADFRDYVRALAQGAAA